MGNVEPFIALTDKAWFDFLSERAVDGRLDEVNFWSPKALVPLKQLVPGEPVFLRLKSPFHAIAGYGFFAHFSMLTLLEAWQSFGWKNGDPDEERFLGRIGGYRGAVADGPGPMQRRLGCTVLREVRFWPRSAWIAWRKQQGWHDNIVRGKTETDPHRVRVLLERITQDTILEQARREWAPSFELVTDDVRRSAHGASVVREGQGSFRARLLDAYGRRCAVSGERTEPILDAAHIQPYLGPPSNHLQNGLVLTKEFHTLFDLGLVTVTPDYDVRVSPAIRDQWSNGRRFYEYDGRRLEVVPAEPHARPSPAALEWHGAKRFRA